MRGAICVDSLHLPLCRCGVNPRLRKDYNTGTWSHKPGGTRVRNTDNNGQTITDPSKCDVSPWSLHCGYMIAVPSNVTIG